MEFCSVSTEDRFILLTIARSLTHQGVNMNSLDIGKWLKAQRTLRSPASPWWRQGVTLWRHGDVWGSLSSPARKPINKMPNLFIIHEFPVSHLCKTVLVIQQHRHMD